MSDKKVNASGRRWRRLVGLVRGVRGATAVEFALLAPVCMLLVCIFIDLCMVMFISNVMEGGLREASRYAITGSVEPGKTREDKIKEVIISHSYGLIDPLKIVITYKVYGSLQSIGQAEPYVDKNKNGQYDAGEVYTDVNANGAWDSDQGKVGVGGPGDIVAYTVTYDWTLWTPMAAEVIGNGGVMTMSATVAVRNEPY